MTTQAQLPFTPACAHCGKQLKAMWHSYMSVIRHNKQLVKENAALRRLNGVGK